MDRINLSWKISYGAEYGETGDWFNANVPGAAQLDCAPEMIAFNEDNQISENHFFFSDNYKKYTWLEDMFFTYSSVFKVEKSSSKAYVLNFEGIDYKYDIFLNSKKIFSGEGMFSPVRLDISESVLKLNHLDVIIYPPPKSDDSNTRNQANSSFKPAVSYGWDFHPRLIPSGLWKNVTLEVKNKTHIVDFDFSYRLNDELNKATIYLDSKISQSTDVNNSVRYSLTDSKGNIKSEITAEVENGGSKAVLIFNNPELWYPVGYGEQRLYTLSATLITPTTEETVKKRVGFRSAKLIMNAGEWERPEGLPKTQSNFPITLEINGIKVFAKGANLVPPEIYFGTITRETYEKLIKKAAYAHMNILRVWGGGIVHKNDFYELCDKYGIMVWQDFPLACNAYVESDSLLEVIQSESTAIIKSLRNHPSLVMWCGGNELFNGWSRMTNQSRILRLIDSLCLRYDPFTPFIHTSPLAGIGHGHYMNCDNGVEAYSMITGAQNTAYTEFGCPGPASSSYLRKLMPEEEYEKCGLTRSWETHHAFDMWRDIDTWLRVSEADYYFDGYSATDDLIEKLSVIQAASAQALFEEMRRQWPRCSMAMTWCLNEPWPTAANNSILSYPVIEKPAYFSVANALRPVMASLRTKKLKFFFGEEVFGEIWFINDTLKAVENKKINVCLCADENQKLISTWDMEQTLPQSGKKGQGIYFNAPITENGIFKIKLEVEGNPEMSSEYTLFSKQFKEKDYSTKLNI